MKIQVVPAALALLCAPSFGPSPVKGFMQGPSLSRRSKSFFTSPPPPSSPTSKHMTLIGKIRDRIEDRVEKIEDRIEAGRSQVKEKIKQQLIIRLGMKVEDFAIDKLIETRLGDASESTKKIFEELDDLISTIACAIGPDILIEMNNDPTLAKDFSDQEVDKNGHVTERFDLGWTKSGQYDWKKGFIPAEIVEITNDVTIKRLRKDAFYGEPSTLMDTATELSTSQVLFPLNDSILSFNSMEEVETLIRDTKFYGRSEGGACPDTYNHWEGDVTSDENFSRFFFHGIGAALLEKVKESSDPALGLIEIDLDFMKDLAVREEFRPMGFKAYFDGNQKVTAIYDSHKETLVKPGDKHWESTKFLARASAFVLLTAREHLFHTHLLAANYLSLASIKHLPPSHPIRRLINVFTFRTNKVNNDAFAALVPEYSVLHRQVGFEYESMMAIFDNAFKTSNVWEPFPKRNMRPELLEMSAKGKLPYHSEGVEYYELVENFVRQWLKQAGYGASDIYAENFYNEIHDSSLGQKYELPAFDGVESIVHVLTQGIFMVTCYHEIIGTVIDYASNPKFVGTRILKDDENGTPSAESDVQNFLLSIVVTASTGLSVPMLMRPYKNYFGVDGAPEWERKTWDDFIDALKVQSEKTRNDKRKDVEFLFMDPEKFESAVSV